MWLQKQISRATATAALEEGNIPQSFKNEIIKRPKKIDNQMIGKEMIPKKMVELQGQH